MAKEAKKGDDFNPLKNKIVYLKQIKRDEFLPKTHEANFLYGDSKFVLCAPISSKTGRIMQVLTPEETEFFENPDNSKYHGFSFEKGDLAPNKSENNVWVTGGQFDIKLKDEMTHLDLSNGHDYIIYKLCLANKDTIANGIEEATEGNPAHKKTFKFALIEEGVEEEQKVSKTNQLKECFKNYGRIESSANKLRAVLMLGYPDRNKRLSAKTKLSFLQSEVSKMIDTNPQKFLDILEDKDSFDMKAVIIEGIDKGILSKDKASIYANNGEDKVGKTLDDAAKNLLDPQYQDLLMDIKKQLEAHNS